MMQTEDVFAQGSQWLAIATCLRGRELNFPELVAESGRSEGALWRQLQDMVSAGLVKRREPGEGHRRGALYMAAAAAELALDEALERSSPPGQLTQGLQALDVRSPSLSSLADVLGESDLASMVAWAAELDGTGQRFLMAFRAQLSATDRGRLILALEAVGAQCTPMVVGDILPGPELARAALSWRLAGLRTGG